MNDCKNEIDLSFIDDAVLSKITLNDIHSFLSYCKDERGNSSVTRARKASAIRGFFKYISDRMGYIDSNPTSQLQVAKSKEKLPKYLTLEQSRELLNSVEGKNKERDYCILTLFLNCGLRLAELVNLNIHDFDLVNKTLVVTGKGNKQRMLYLNKACVDSIMAYLAVRPHDGLKGDARNALFISRLNKRIGRQAVQLMVYGYLEKIGLDGQHYSVHKLRHTAATLMYQHSGVDVLVLKDLLGHENLSTTEIYTHIENKQLREAISKNPLSGESLDNDNSNSD
ncbi:MAG: tyrosine-type recombinase/integrase [Acutalibacteraceae bacterium]